MRIETERLLICDFGLEDADDLYETLSDKEVMRYIEPPYTYEQTKTFILEAGMSEPPLVFALKMKTTGKVIGHIIYHLYGRNDIEIGWILNKNYWGTGIASEVTEALIRQGKMQKADGLVIECAPDQMASKHIAMKNGFCYVGKDVGCEIYKLEL